jgi:hypothetical protein
MYQTLMANKDTAEIVLDRLSNNDNKLKGRNGLIHPFQNGDSIGKGFLKSTTSYIIRKEKVLLSRLPKSENSQPTKYDNQR